MENTSAPSAQLASSIGSGPAIRRSTAERPISKPRIAVKIATARAAIVSARWWPKG